MNTKRGSRVTRSAKGKTDWAKLKAMPDKAIRFTKDAPRTSPEDWANAVAHRGLPLPVRKEQIALRVDADVLAWFRAQGSGWQTRMNEVLKAYWKAMAKARPNIRLLQPDRGPLATMRSTNAPRQAMARVRWQTDARVGFSKYVA